MLDAAILGAVLASIVAAATTLLLASLGELVAERAGTLNLGVEGMMIVGAAVGYATAYGTGSLLLGTLAAILAGMALSLVFAGLAIWLATNQVASGLATTILGLGVAGLIGAPFVGTRLDGAPALKVPGLTDLPVIGQMLFGQDAFVYASLVLLAAVTYGLARTRVGLVLRAVGESHAAAHALGHPVRRIRTLAVMFGGACAGLAGAHLSLAYTPFWASDMTAGRGWIALALVVFSAWKPLWLLAGAYLFGAVSILQLHVQGFGLGIPSQLLSALPYLATIVALVAISALKRGQGAPASLGVPFVPDR
ncbi:simple sugar transport system permease protein [Angulomicrobium tetraedrale]|uniref:Simple sugar transport system permease protein n=1 Tax=Ancylobacter tetraedralis TaxID=217068 RepID=A0A839ZEE0_9HYPH|nr:ABC transporter permease [Ancylobacter tetraedralis]MBB3773026.1 simple sugar transport system permease protein [Ancylobacter tetraedralis]